MQDMRTEYCAQTPVEPASGSTKQLIDIRDGKKYWVTKLKDENCWMTQNLDYDITDQRISSGSINPANTDIAYTWNYDSEYPPRPTITNNDFGPEDYTNPNATYSWDVGEYMIADSATNATSCGTIPSGTQPINKNCNRLQLYDNNAENAHYLVGNYYQFNTLTAGSGDIGENQQSTSSICPKGWTLARNHGSGSYADLAKEYSAMLDQDGSVIILTQAPLYFTRAGFLNLSSQPKLLGEVGNYGYYRTNVVISSTIATFLGFFDSSKMYVYAEAAKSAAMSARCVAR